jgi:phenylalanyl-tRNA synthetase beta chain
LAGSDGRVEATDAFEAVRIIAPACGVEVMLRASLYLAWLPGRCAEVFIGEALIGHAGQLR